MGPLFMDQQHMMVDLETLGTGQDAVILQIGASIFQPSNLGAFNQGSAGFLTGVTVESQKTRSITDGTLAFWMHPDQEDAREAHRHIGKKLHLDEALVEFGRFVRAHKPEHVWANGSVFDLGILRDAFAKGDYDLPWSFRAERDTRTVKELVRACPTATLNHEALHNIVDGTAHQALSDCQWQMQELVIYFRALGLQ